MGSMAQSNVVCPTDKESSLVSFKGNFAVLGFRPDHLLLPSLRGKECEKNLPNRFNHSSCQDTSEESSSEEDFEDQLRDLEVRSRRSNLKLLPNFEYKPRLQQQAHSAHISFVSSCQHLSSFTELAREDVANEKQKMVSRSPQKTRTRTPSKTRTRTRTPPRTRRLPRLTPRASHLLQLTFNECASPSLKLKRVLAKKAGLTVHQVNMWMSLQRKKSRR